MSKKDNKRDRILAAAAELFMSKGFHDTKIIDIANKAEVGKGTVYQYFSSKNQLFEALFHEKIMDTCQNLKQILASAASASDKLLDYIAFEYNAAEEMNINPTLLYNVMMDFTHTGTAFTLTSIKHLMTRRFEILYDIISEGIANGEFAPVDPVMATTTTIGAINTYHFLNLDVFSEIHEEVHPLLRQRETSQNHNVFCDILLNGLTGGVRKKSA